MLANTRRTYSLATFTVENRGGKWYFWPTYSADRKDAKGPYGSEASVTLMIARQLRREIIKRDAAHQLPE